MAEKPVVRNATDGTTSSPEVKLTCFVISPIGDAGTEVRRRSDQVLRHIIDPAVTTLGYKTLRADQIAEPGMITSQILQHVIDDQLVVADLTDRNPNVYYELAVRHAIRKPLIQLIKKGEALPFDVAGTRTIHFDHQDLDSVQEAKSEIIKQLEFLKNHPADIESPISVSLDLQNLRQSENPEERSLGDILSVVSELRSAISILDKRISDPTLLLPPGYLREITSNFRTRDANAVAREFAMMSSHMGELLASQKGNTVDKKELIEINSRMRTLAERFM